MADHVLDGSFEGVVDGFRWSKWEDEDTGRSVPILSFDVKIGENKVFPSLFFDNELATTGIDAGKSRVSISLDILRSYGLDLNPQDPASNNPHEFGPEMVGKTISVFCKAGKEGKQKCYINRAHRPELAEEEVTALWAEMTSGASSSPAGSPPPPAADAGDDDLVF